MAIAPPSGPIAGAAPKGATGLVLLASGEVFWGRGFGAEGAGVGEICFNTAMTGYQEVMTDPSYAGQIINFTFPHIGNVGANGEDAESNAPAAIGCIVRENVTGPSNFRSAEGFDAWMAANGRIGIAGIDTRALTRFIRENGAPNGVIAHNAAGQFDLDELAAMARGWAGLEGADLAREVSRTAAQSWQAGRWVLGRGYPTPFASSDVEMPLSSAPSPRVSTSLDTNATGAGGAAPRVVAVDYGIKDNILRNLVDAGCDVMVVPATASFDEIMAHKPDGIFLSNGPGDPAATGDHAVPVIRALMDAGVPIFGICLGHQLLALAVGGRTIKMHQGHRGANHPVKRHSDGAVEITSMNHGFAVDAASLPAGAEVTHTSLFDGSNCGFAWPEKKIFSVQYHPEASPGPQDSLYLFQKFVGDLRANGAGGRA